MAATEQCLDCDQLRVRGGGALTANSGFAAGFLPKTMQTPKRLGCWGSEVDHGEGVLPCVDLDARGEYDLVENLELRGVGFRFGEVFAHPTMIAHSTCSVLCVDFQPLVLRHWRFSQNCIGNSSLDDVAPQCIDLAQGLLPYAYD